MANSPKSPPSSPPPRWRVRMPLGLGLGLLAVLVLASKQTNSPLREIFTMAAMIIALWTAFSLNIPPKRPEYRDSVFFPGPPDIHPDTLPSDDFPPDDLQPDDLQHPPAADTTADTAADTAARKSPKKPSKKPSKKSPKRLAKRTPTKPQQHKDS